MRPQLKLLFAMVMLLLVFETTRAEQNIDDTQAVVDYFMLDPKFEQQVNFLTDRVLQNTPKSLPFLPSEFWVRNRSAIRKRIEYYQIKTVIYGVNILKVNMTAKEFTMYANYVGSSAEHKISKYNSTQNPSLESTLASNPQKLEDLQSVLTASEYQYVEALVKQNLFKDWSVALTKMVVDGTRHGQVDDDANWADFMLWLKQTAITEGYVRS